MQLEIEHDGQPHHLMLIDGAWTSASSQAFIAVENPACKRTIAYVPRANEIDVDIAVTAASRAFVGWRRIPARDRGKVLLRIAEAIEPNVEAIAKTIALETGNALRTQARPEASDAADIFRYFGGLASELKGETLPLSEQVLSYTRREPIGVVGAIIPWNTPVELAALKIAPALCAGNSIVLKAAEDAPLAVLMLAKICQLYLPAGVLNVLTGLGEECGAALARHPGVRTMSFTGSTGVGRSIMRAASERIAPVSLELGGKSPSIVYPDAHQDWVIDGVVHSMRFTRQSQSCTAGSRLFVHKRIFDTFVDRLAQKVDAMRIGDPLDEHTDIGTLINGKQHKKVSQFIEEGIANNARLVTGGLLPDEGPLSHGYYAKPTIFAGIDNSWRLAREEIFGPVLAAIPWDDEDQCVAMANDSHFGLAAYVWTHDIARGLRCAHAIEAGWVQVNQGRGQVLGQSYGGVKQSGMGRECSLEGMLDSFTQRKSVTVNLEQAAAL